LFQGANSAAGRAMPALHLLLVPWHCLCMHAAPGVVFQECIGRSD
jgi:hypothetical protein